MINRWVSLLLLLLYTNYSYSQDSVKHKKVKVLPVPAFGYSPETEAYVGAVTLFTIDLYNDSLTRTSNAKFEFNYTWKKQLILETEWNYFFKEEKWFTKGRIHFSDFPDQYWGIGSEAPENNKITFSSKRFITDIFVLKRIYPKVFTGINIRHINYSNVTYDQSLASYPELTNSYNYGIGYSFLKDTRNSLLTPLKGVYFNINAGYNFGTGNYTKTLLDLRYYKTWKGKYTIATRLANESNFGSPPFYDMAFLGGDKFVRGYYYGRYRDNNLTTIQMEARGPVFRRFGMAVFGGISEICNTYDQFNLTSIKPNYGMGIRFIVDKKERTNLRIDYAMGAADNNGFYISFGESF